MQRRRLSVLESHSEGDATYRPEDYERRHELSSQVRALQRAALRNLRNHQKISDEVMRKLEYEIGLVDAGYSGSETP